MKFKFILLRLTLYFISAFLFFMTSLLFTYIDYGINGFAYIFVLYLIFILLPVMIIRHFIMKYFIKFEVAEEISFHRNLEILLNRTTRILSIIIIILMTISLYTESIIASKLNLNNQNIPFFSQYGLMIGLLVSSIVLLIIKKIKPYVILM